MTSREVKGPTPGGAPRATLYFLDEHFQPVDEEEAVRAEVVEEAEGGETLRTYFDLKAGEPDPGSKSV